jgi:hypothetical protein
VFLSGWNYHADVSETNIIHSSWLASYIICSCFDIQTSSFGDSTEVVGKICLPWKFGKMQNLPYKSTLWHVGFFMYLRRNANALNWKCLLDQKKTTYTLSFPSYSNNNWVILFFEGEKVFLNLFFKFTLNFHMHLLNDNVTYPNRWSLMALE